VLNNNSFALVWPLHEEANVSSTKNSSKVEHVRSMCSIRRR